MQPGFNNNDDDNFIHYLVCCSHKYVDSQFWDWATLFKYIVFTAVYFGWLSPQSGLDFLVSDFHSTYSNFTFVKCMKCVYFNFSVYYLHIVID